VSVTRIKIKKGLNLPIEGSPEQRIVDGPAITRVGVVGPDFLGLKPTMMVEEGQTVALGTPLFEDKRNPGVIYTAPAAGVVCAINRGAQRVLQSVVIEISGSETVKFSSYPAAELATLDRTLVRDQIVASGLWTALRRRPYSKIPAIDEVPAAIFVTAIDSNPLAPDPQVVLKGRESDFEAGVTALSRLSGGEVFVCKAPDAAIPAPGLDSVKVVEFEGPHPAGLPGTHIHFLKPVGSNRCVWYINYQDCAAIGHLFLNGVLDVSRVISLAGPMVESPTLIRTRMGANVDELTASRLKKGECRVLSGSIWNGRRTLDWASYLGRYHVQLTALAEGRTRELFGWVAPGSNKFSVNNVFVSALVRASRRFRFTTTTNGSPRAMVPIGNYEKVMPLDILPTQLLRYLLVKDTDMVQQLGGLELDEEDLSLCSYVCVGKHEFGPVLRENLEQIETDG